MSTSTQKRQIAENLYNTGNALFQDGLFSEALIELRRAEDAFRMWDALGHPFTSRLPNGMSGLANTLLLSGLCCQKLGNFKDALTCYETSLINAKFEKNAALRAFRKTLAENMIVCYENILKDSVVDRERFSVLDPDIDMSFRYPHSLAPDLVPFARLYELAPERYPQYKAFYNHTKKKDSELRRVTKTSDESTLRRTSIYVWGILATIWAIYGLITIRALGDH
jgi:tetratricopeptide (TPR) repeat protein